MIFWFILCFLLGGAAAGIEYYLKIKRDKDQYYSSTYYRFTQKDYKAVMNDTGALGEYDTYKSLKKHEDIGGRFLYNVYLPKEDGTTTEIDMLLITPKGIFVFESKNFSGIIFGEYDQKNWTQYLNRHTKEHFYNPIKQNETHIKYLKEQLKMIFGPVPKNIAIYSMVVFSKRCKLGKVPEFTADTFVIKRENVERVVDNIIMSKASNDITYKEVDEIQKALFAYTQKTKQEKEKHVEDIRSKSAINYERTSKDDALKNRLKGFRTETARKYRKPPYYIFNDEELEKLIAIKPKTQAEVYNILPKVKANYYSKEIVKIINEEK
ncbi:MAG: NERD domain-containing protein [Clostridia bacterium]|nr:NERD domain-containing protein [Clostridia bacterium]